MQFKFVPEKGTASDVLEVKPQELLVEWKPFYLTFNNQDKAEYQTL